MVIETYRVESGNLHQTVLTPTLNSPQESYWAFFHHANLSLDSFVLPLTTPDYLSGHVSFYQRPSLLVPAQHGFTLHLACGLAFRVPMGLMSASGGMSSKAACMLDHCTNSPHAFARWE